jgi:hypothetical protein
MEGMKAGQFAVLEPEAPGATPRDNPSSGFVHAPSALSACGLGPFTVMAMPQPEPHPTPVPSHRHGLRHHGRVHLARQPQRLGAVLERARQLAHLAVLAVHQHHVRRRHGVQEASGLLKVRVRGEADVVHRHAQRDLRGRGGRGVVGGLEEGRDAEGVGSGGGAGVGCGVQLWGRGAGCAGLVRARRALVEDDGAGVQAASAGARRLTLRPSRVVMVLGPLRISLASVPLKEKKGQTQLAKLEGGRSTWQERARGGEVCVPLQRQGTRGEAQGSLLSSSSPSPNAPLACTA